VGLNFRLEEVQVGIVGLYGVELPPGGSSGRDSFPSEPEATVAMWTSYRHSPLSGQGCPDPSDGGSSPDDPNRDPSPVGGSGGLAAVNGSSSSGQQGCFCSFAGVPSQRGGLPVGLALLAWASIVALGRRRPSTTD